jgi:NDP-sugar pyrophosphorylase family protein
LFLILKNLEIFDIFDHIISNEDVINSKPSAEIYYKCFIKENVSPTDCIIFEDSIIGTESAIKSGANVCNIKNSNDLTIEKINKAITYYENKIILQKTPFMKNINVVIPMSGNGSRFSIKGYIKPKPLIDVFDTPMITSVIKNIGFDANYIFIVKKEHVEKYNVDSILKSIVPDCKIIEISETTEGAACTVLLAKKFLIENNYPLLISNCDQYLDWDPHEFINNFLIEKFLGALYIRGIIRDGFIDFFKGTVPQYDWERARRQRPTSSNPKPRVIE